MLKSRRNLYRKQRRRSLPLPAILMAIPVALILLEVLLRIFVLASGKKAELAAYKGEPASVSAYRLKFLSQTLQPYDGLSAHGDLAAQRRLAVGYGLVRNQRSNFWRINEQGFRDDDPVPLAKPKGEIRIFLLGGSTAFGQGSASNQATIASALEARLNERIAQQKRSPENYRPATLPYTAEEQQKVLARPPQLRGGQYRVINAAVPGYASGNELAQLAFQILPYSPDVIVVLDGYADLMLPSQQAQVDVPNIETFLSDASGHFQAHLARQWQHLITNMYLVRATQYWLLRPHSATHSLTLVTTDATTPLEEQLPADLAELDRRVRRYRDVRQQMVRFTTGTRIPLVVAIQPEITGRGAAVRSPQEQEILQELGGAYIQGVKGGYVQLDQANRQLQKDFPKTVKTLNFYKLYETFPEPAFLDTIHLTQEANAVLAQEFYQAIAAMPQLQIALSD